MKDNFFGSKLNTFLLLILIVLMVLALIFMYKNKDVYLPVLSDRDSDVKINKNMPTVENKNMILGNREDLVAFSVAPNTKVSGIVSYRGIVEGGYFFEGNILINILNSDKKILKASNAVAKDEWMTIAPVNFEGNIDFTGLKKGPAYIEIHNDNASGLPENDKSILIPIVIE